MADESYAPKPLPPDLPLPLWSRIWSRTLIQVTWPWYARKLKRAGFVRTGWMTWETGPELRAAITDEILTSMPLCPIELEDP